MPNIIWPRKDGGGNKIAQGSENVGTSKTKLYLSVGAVIIAIGFAAYFIF